MSKKSALTEEQKREYLEFLDANLKTAEASGQTLRKWLHYEEDDLVKALLFKAMAVDHDRFVQIYDATAKELIELTTKEFKEFLKYFQAVGDLDRVLDVEKSRCKEPVCGKEGMVAYHISNRIFDSAQRGAKDLLDLSRKYKWGEETVKAYEALFMLANQDNPGARAKLETVDASQVSPKLYQQVVDILGVSNFKAANQPEEGLPIIVQTPKDIEHFRSKLQPHLEAIERSGKSLEQWLKAGDRREVGEVLMYARLVDADLFRRAFDATPPDKLWQAISAPDCQTLIRYFFNEKDYDRFLRLADSYQIIAEQRYSTEHMVAAYLLKGDAVRAVEEAQIMIAGLKRERGSYSKVTMPLAEALLALAKGDKPGAAARLATVKLKEFAPPDLEFYRWFFGKQGVTFPTT